MGVLKEIIKEPNKRVIPIATEENTPATYKIIEQGQDDKVAYVPEFYKTHNYGRLLLDNFPSEDVIEDDGYASLEEWIADGNLESTGQCNWYELIGEIIYGGKVYYLWVNECHEGDVNVNSDPINFYYVATPTDSWNANETVLGSQNYSARTVPYVFMMSEDLQTTYTKNDEEPKLRYLIDCET